MKLRSDCIVLCQSYFLVLNLIFVTINAVADEETEEVRECGQYGFICLNEKTLQFCPIAIDGVTDAPHIYECDENFTCDEDNPSYCTPKEAPNKFLQEASKTEHPAGLIENNRVSNNYDEIYYGDNLYYRQVRAANVESREDSCACESTSASPEQETTTEDSNDDDETDFKTINFTPSQPFECDSYGFFPDKRNTSLFWHCDVPLNGNGFLLRHMKCGLDRSFDETLKSCVLRGTIRQERNYNSSNSSNTDIEISKRKIKYTSDCKNRKPGKYADEFDCQVYHLCLSKQFSPAIQLSFVCPRQTAYDCISRSCTIAAFKRCETKSLQSNNINCKSPMRFRSIDDCRSYFVCFGDNVIEIKCPKYYKFDDDSMECLPEKLAHCKEFPT